MVHKCGIVLNGKLPVVIMNAFGSQNYQEFISTVLKFAVS